MTGMAHHHRCLDGAAMPGRPLPGPTGFVRTVRAWLADQLFGDPTLEALDRLPDRLLHDVGLTRADLRMAAHRSRAERPRVLARAVSRRRRTLP